MANFNASTHKPDNYNNNMWGFVFYLLIGYITTFNNKHFIYTLPLKFLRLLFYSHHCKHLPNFMAKFNTVDRLHYQF